MKKYIVGGYCRDRLLGLTPKDKDYVLVGANQKDIEYLKSIGYKQVGADFPVFLSPAGDEYALARTERKAGSGYTGFEVKTKGVTLEDDLYRRDLTINAIAYDPTVQMHVDPYGGRQDLANGILRHVSDAFKEDPLRVLRLARFAARYKKFTVHESTDAMVREMVQNGELNTLTKERVYVEFEKAFSDGNPEIFLQYLHDIGALKVLLPDYNYSRRERKYIEYISEKSTPEFVSYYIWTMILRKSKTLQDNTTYEFGSVKVPSRFVRFAQFVVQHTESIVNFRKMEPQQMVDLLSSMNIRNNGGDDFLYKVTEYFLLRRIIAQDLEDLLFKVYDAYTNAPLGDIQDMVHRGELQPADILTYVRNTRISAIKKMF